MRITIDIDRQGGRPRIRSGWFSSGGDDIRLRNLGVTLYTEWADRLERIAGGPVGRNAVIQNLGERR